LEVAEIFSSSPRPTSGKIIGGCGTATAAKTLIKSSPKKIQKFFTIKKPALSQARKNFFIRLYSA
jgi:hypothetical protein